MVLMDQISCEISGYNFFYYFFYYPTTLTKGTFIPTESGIRTWKYGVTFISLHSCRDYLSHYTLFSLTIKNVPVHVPVGLL